LPKKWRKNSKSQPKGDEGGFHFENKLLISSIITSFLKIRLAPLLLKRHRIQRLSQKWEFYLVV